MAKRYTLLISYRYNEKKSYNKKEYFSLYSIERILLTARMNE